MRSGNTIKSIVKNEKPLYRYEFKWGSIMKNLTKLLLLGAICVAVITFTVELAFGAPAADDATCDISVTVNEIMEWEPGNFPAIDLHTHADGPITTRTGAPEDTADFTLWTNGDVALSADDTAQLTDGTDVLITKYKISTDGDGSGTTGADGDAVTASHSDSWEDHDDFLDGSYAALAITHVATDGGVEITLEVQATNEADEVADAGDYTATQTITATWVP